MALAAALAFASGPALANPGMGGMGGEAHHHANPSPQPKPAPAPPPPPKPKGGGCSSCGGKADGGSHISPGEARQRAGDAAAGMDDGETNVTIGSGGRRSEDLTGAIAQLGAAEGGLDTPTGENGLRWHASDEFDGLNGENNENKPDPSGSDRDAYPVLDTGTALDWHASDEFEGLNGENKANKPALSATGPAPGATPPGKPAVSPQAPPPKPSSPDEGYTLQDMLNQADDEPIGVGTGSAM